MRHRKKGRRLGRSSSHKKAMLRNLVTSLILTEREDDYYDGLYQADGTTPVSPPKYKGRVVTTLHKAKEVRSLVEKCVTIARNAIKHDDKAAEFETDADRNTAEWEAWRKSDQWQEWVNARAPGVAARRRVYDILQGRKKRGAKGTVEAEGIGQAKEAVSILFDVIAPRFEDRPGGYTRILKLAKPRLGDAGAQAILEFVGKNDRVAVASERPEFDSDDEPVATVDADEVEEEVTEDEVTENEVSESADETSAEAADGDAADGGAEEDADGEEKKD